MEANNCLQWGRYLQSLCRPYFENLGSFFLPFSFFFFTVPGAWHASLQILSVPHSLPQYVCGCRVKSAHKNSLCRPGWDIQKDESGAKSVVSVFFFSLTPLHMYLCRMVWLNHKKIKFNEQKIILKESLNSYLYISYNLHICKYTFLYVKVTSSCFSGYEEVGLPWKGGVCCLGGCESRTLSCFHFQLSVGQGSSLGTMCLRVLDICFSALRI